MTTDELLQRWSDGSITADELRELTAKLAEPEHQSALLDDWLLESSLPDRLPGASVACLPEAQRTTGLLAASEPPQTRKWTGWLSWRPLAAAAAGLVFGMFCTSVVFAYVRPTWEPTITLLKEGFESGEPPLVKGMPSVPDRWSGDFTEVVGEHQGVKPSDGKKMLRVLRIDSEDKVESEDDRFMDLYRLVDVRSYREQCADGAAVVQFSAGFNAFAFPEGKTYFCRMSVQAYDTQAAADRSARVGEQRESEVLASARAGRLHMDRDPTTWQRMGGDLRVPPGTNFLLVHLRVHEQRGAAPYSDFAGHYIDDVRLTMTRRPPPL